MLSSVLLAYYIHQFSVPVQDPHRTDRSSSYIRQVHPRGNLTVDAESSNAGSIAPGSQRVELLRLRLQADCSGDVDIHGIAVQRRGLGSNADLERVYAVHRNSRISRARTFSRRDGSVDLNIRNFRLPACESEDVTLLVDVSPSASPAGEHTLELRSIDAGSSSVRIAQRKGDFTRTRRTASRTVGQLAVDYLNLSRRIRFGTSQTLLRFTVESDNKDNHVLRAVTFTNNGSASDKDLRNLFIAFRNKRITSFAPSLRGDTVRLEFDPPFYVQKNTRLKFSLKGDVKASRSRTIQFVVEEEGDLEASPVRGR